MQSQIPWKCINQRHEKVTNFKLTNCDDNVLVDILWGSFPFYADTLSQLWFIYGPISSFPFTYWFSKGVT